VTSFKSVGPLSLGDLALYLTAFKENHTLVEYKIVPYEQESRDYLFIEYDNISL
jgi:hypothetical protein